MKTLFIGRILRKFLHMNKRIIEGIFACVSVITFVLFKLNIISQVWFIVIILIWAVLAIVGFFIPTISQWFNFNCPGVSKHETLIPIVVKTMTTGGFIAGQRITIRAYIVDFSKRIDSKTQFRNTFDYFSIRYYKSFEYPLQKGKDFLVGEPTAGGVDMDMASCSGDGNIIFNAPDKYSITIHFIKKNTKREEYAKIDDPKIETELTISPAENFIQFRFFSITYGLTLLILLLAVISAGLI